MLQTRDLPGRALRRWRFPELDAPAELGLIAAPADSAPDQGRADPAKQQCDEAEDAVDGGADAPHAIGAGIEHELAKGYAEGVQRGVIDGREQGYAEGFAAGSKAAQQSLAEEAQRVAAIVNRLCAPLPAVERVIEDALVALALELARCVIGSEVTQSRDSLVRLIREALSQVPLRLGGLRISLHPADLELIRGLAPEIERGGAVLIGDPAVEAGGCLILVDGETPIKDRRWRPRAGDGASQVDLSLAARWRSAMLALFDGEGK